MGCALKNAIRIVVIFLVVFFVIVSLQDLHAADTTSGKYIFEYCYTNAAWGYQLYGSYIDSEGDVWKYDRSSDPWQPSRMDGIYYDFDLKAKFKDAKKTGTVDKAVLTAMASLIETASQGELIKRSGGKDMGAASYIAYLYDSAADSYREVLLASRGDFNIDSTSSAAKTLTQWLESVFSQQQSQTESGGSQQPVSRGKIRAGNPELRVIQKIPALKPEIRVEQKGPFPIEEGEKQGQ